MFAEYHHLVNLAVAYMEVMEVSASLIIVLSHQQTNSLFITGFCFTNIMITLIFARLAEFGKGG